MITDSVCGCTFLLLLFIFPCFTRYVHVKGRIIHARKTNKCEKGRKKATSVCGHVKITGSYVDTKRMIEKGFFRSHVQQMREREREIEKHKNALS